MTAAINESVAGVAGEVALAASTGLPDVVGYMRPA